MIGRTTAHLLNVLILISYMILWNFFTRTYVYPAPTVKLPSESRWLRLSLAWFIRISLLIQLPFYCLSLFSFITYFPYDVIFGVKPAKRRFDPESLPLMVVRIVTRGHYRDIIEKSVATHKRLFEQAGVEKYLIQVVTENSLSLTTGTGEKVEEILVPTDYRTPHGTLFKARNLTYAQLHPTKSVKESVKREGKFWLIHLDEETLMTESSMAGTLDLILEGKYRWGHGLVVYGWHRIDNIWTTYCDSHRVAFDVGVLHTAIAYWHRSQVYIKGGFIVMRSDLQDEIGFDFGPKIIQEDWAIAMELAKRQEPIGWIEGAVMEESPETIWGVMKQRGKWLKGVAYLLAQIRFKVSSPILVFCHIYGWFSAPLLLTAHLAAAFISPLDHYIPVVDDICSLVDMTHAYGYAYGSLINFNWSLTTRVLVYLFSLTAVPTILASLVEIWGTTLGHLTLYKEVLTNKQPSFTHTEKAAGAKKSSAVH